MTEISEHFVDLSETEKETINKVIDKIWENRKRNREIEAEKENREIK